MLNNDKMQQLEEQWDKEREERSEDEVLEDAFFEMEMLIYSSRSLRVEGNSNVKITEVPDKKDKK